MRHLLSVRKVSVLCLSIVAIATVAGCGPNDAPISFIDLVNTVLLGITAAGGLVLMQNV